MNQYANLITLVTNEPAKILRSWVTRNYPSDARQKFGLEHGEKFSNRWSKAIILGFLESQTGSLELWNGSQTSAPVAAQANLPVSSAPVAESVKASANSQTSAPVAESEKSSNTSLHVSLVDLAAKCSNYLVRKSDREIKTLADNIPYFNLILIGIAGIGKTLTAQRLALKRGFPSITFSMSTDTALRELLTKRELVQGSTETKIGRLLALLQIPSTIILDEISMLPARYVVKLFELLAGNTLYIADLNRTITRHPDCVIVCTGNPSDPNYPGVEKMSVAFVDRFEAYDIPEFTKTQISNITGVTESESEFFITLRKSLVSQRKRAVLSLRSIISYQRNKQLLGVRGAAKMLEAKLGAMDPTTKNMVHGSSLQSLAENSNVQEGN